MTESDSRSPSPRKCDDGKSSYRKSNKPLMEKRRRARINTCLSQLKTLVLQAMKKDNAQYSKLEKADILELTVKHLRHVQRHQMAAAMATSPDVITKYRAGFNECANEIMRYLTSVQGVNDDVRTRVLGHLAGCLQAINPSPINDVMQHSGHVLGVPPVQHPAFVTTCTTPSNASAFQSMIADKSQIPQQNNIQVSCLTSSQTSAAPFQLIPGTLPGGQVALVLTSPSSMQAVPLYAAPPAGSDRTTECVSQVKTENTSPLAGVRVPKVFTSQPEPASSAVMSPPFGNHGNSMLLPKQPEASVRNAPSPEQVWRPW
ncbi:transcription factor HES-1-like [Gigantopelta aegis]|uniref:transcription factor HES-1-like n=1 Tax=Gigantopelta aegis TaxID=1735272 RepID=UPI001B88930F|nr:transcription factor HES-1-like [Gigantopelta aegis]